MNIQERPIEYYVERLQQNDYFTLFGYSDAEWFCIFNYEPGKATGLGQILNAEVGVKLLDVLRRHHKDPRVMVAVPKCMWEWSDFVTMKAGLKIETIMRLAKLTPCFVERDMILDDLAAAAGLHPFIHQLRQMRTVVIGNHALVGLDFLDYDKFIGVESPNLHLNPRGIAKAVRQAKDYGRPAVYLVSAGISAALIIDQLHNEIPDSFFIDCGSIWDAFVGIGGQRQWRRRLYEDPQALEQWKHENLYGKS